MEIAQRVDDWAQSRGIRLPVDKKAIVVKHLYLQLAARGRIDEATVAETLRMAA